MNSPAFQRKSTGQTYRLEAGVWRGPHSAVITLTRLQEKIALRFLESPGAILTADKLQAELGAGSSSADPTAYRRHVAAVNKAFGFKLVRTLANSGIRGDARSRRAAYRLSEDIEPPHDAASAAAEAPSLLETFGQALLRRRDWLTIRPVLSSGAEVNVEDLYVEVFLRNSAPGILSNSDWLGGIFGNVEEQETERSVGAAHYITAESLVARTAGRTVIIGPPGSGKTTLVKWFCAYLLSQYAATDSATDRTPIPVSLRDFAESLQAGRTRSLAEFAFTAVLRKAPAEVPANLPALYLLDGWDEVPVAMRADVLAEIDSATADAPVLITSRPNAAAFLTRGPQTATFELGTLADGAVAELCTRYGEMRGRADLVPGLLYLIENSPGLWPLAGSPYLLTLLCEVVFAAAQLPKAAVISPVWVLAHAIDLIRLDYNGSYPANPLTLAGLDRIERLAHAMSFGQDIKRTTFEPDSELGQSRNDFIESPAGRSRFFNATGIAATSFAFVHLRLQEYLAARRAVRNVDNGAPWLQRHLLSQIRREEARFAAAMAISSGHPPRGFVAALCALIETPDRTGESIRCVAAVLAAAGVRDGGLQSLGADLRELLWQRVVSEPWFLNEYAQSLVELDAAFLLERLSHLKSDDMLFEHLYRFVPLSIRQARLDPLLARSSLLSWVIGLPGRGFPTRQALDALADTATDPNASAEERIHALRDLGSYRARSQGERLAPLLAAPDEEIAIATAETLGKIGGRQAAAALATALISIQESDALERPGWVAALLNALAVIGYGAIEPYSRDIMVGHIENAPDSCPNIELTLDALAGTPLPQPPTRILEFLADQTPSRKSLRKAAASALRGVGDAGFLNRALRLLASEPSRTVREHILRSAQFIPVNCPEIGPIWELCVSGATSESSHAFGLVSRTVARYPNHPLARPLSGFIGDALEKIAAGRLGPMDAPILRGLRTIPPTEGVRTTLLRILTNPSIPPDLQTDVAGALAMYRLSAPDLEFLKARLADALRLGKDGSALASALAVTLFAHRPESAPELLKELTQDLDTVGTGPRDEVLRAAHRTGFLIFHDHVVGPDGRVLPAAP